MPETCCCCFSLKTGAHILGICTTIACVSALIVGQIFAYDYQVYNTSTYYPTGLCLLPVMFSYFYMVSQPDKDRKMWFAVSYFWGYFAANWFGYFTSMSLFWALYSEDSWYIGVLAISPLISTLFAYYFYTCLEAHAHRLEEGEIHQQQ